jgi:hypothetical protein
LWIRIRIDLGQFGSGTGFGKAKKTPQKRKNEDNSFF